VTTAIVVGSGPNGLAAAARLARAGIEVTVLEAADSIGGGTRSSEMIVPGLLHDHCSAFHPIAAASPIIEAFDLATHGLRWRVPEIDCAHPLDDGHAALLHRSIDDTAAGLGADGARWRRLFTALTSNFDQVFSDVTKPATRIPRHPIATGRFGVAAMAPATVLGRLFRETPTRALWAGNAAHVYHPLNRPMSSAVAVMILTAGHVHGWVVAEGGSQSIADALAADITANGGVIETGQRVSATTDLAKPDVLMLDVAPSAAATILGDRLPPKVAKAYRRFRHGPGAFKVDFAIEGGVPWAAEGPDKAGTVHLGGDHDEIVANELSIHCGDMPDRPFVLVGQQYLADPSRSVGDVHPLWTYAHVPHGYQGDATEAIIAQIERFAPGFRERVVAMAVRSTTEMSTYNANFIGGDIIGGASTPRQLLFRPRFGTDPYATGIDGVWLCSASTPPGAGAHGMCGLNAADRALAALP